MPLPQDPLIVELDQERQKYSSDTHEPTTHQLHRFSASCQLLKEEIQVLRQSPSSTRQRKLIARNNLEKISKLSSSVFILYSFFVTVTETGKKSHLEILPKLRAWWEGVEHPQRLLEKAKVFCDLEGIEYVETVHSSKDYREQCNDDHPNPMSEGVLLCHDKTPMLQLSFLPSEPPHEEVGLTTRYFIDFVQTSNALTNRPAAISILERYEISCPNVKLKLPWYGAFPSIEIKVTSDVGPSVVLTFSWEFANDLLYSLGISTANVAN